MGRPRPHRLLAAPLIMLALPALAAEPAAQPASDAPRAVRPPLALELGRRLQLQLPQGLQEGELVGYTPDALTLRTSPGNDVGLATREHTRVRTVPAGEVEALSLAHTQVGQGVAVGGALGFGLGMLGGCFVGRLQEYGSCLGSGLLGGSVIALAGAGVGALLGLRPRWERLYVRRFHGPLVLAAPAAPPPAALPVPVAQPAPAADAPRARSRLIFLGNGSELLLTLSEGPRAGVLVGRTRDTLTLNMASGLRTVPAGEVEALAERHYPVGRSALVGGGIGLALGALGGCGRGLFETYERGEKCVSGGALLGGLGALLGAGIGALVGQRSPDWKPVYRRSVDGPLVLAAPEPPASPASTPPRSAP